MSNEFTDVVFLKVDVDENDVSVISCHVVTYLFPVTLAMEKEMLSVHSEHNTVVPLYKDRC